MVDEQLLPAGIRLVIGDELIELSSWSELEERLDFAGRLEESEYFPLNRIVGVYLLPEVKQCGRSECGRWHKKGYVAETAKGQLLNIGNKCGANYFQVDYNDLAAQFDRFIGDLTRRRRLREFKEKRGGLLERALELRAAADQLKVGIKELKNPDHLVPRRVTEKLSEMTAARDPILRIERRLTQEEREARKAMGQRQQSEVEQDEVARIPGLSALYPENDFREVVYLGLQKPLEDFAEIDLNSLSEAEELQWSKLYSEIDARQRAAKSALDAAERLLTRSSLEHFKVILDPAEGKVFDRFIRDFGRSDSLG